MPAEFAEHWQEALTFLGLLRTAWPAILAAEGRLEATQRRRLLLDALVREWQARPPGPVVAAGITGTIPAVGRLLATVARLPDGQVVLHGLDRTLGDSIWAAIEPVHPQYGVKRLLERIGIDRAAVTDWHPGPGSRRRPHGGSYGARRCAPPPSPRTGEIAGCAPTPWPGSRSTWHRTPRARRCGSRCACARH